MSVDHVLCHEAWAIAPNSFTITVSFEFGARLNVIADATLSKTAGYDSRAGQAFAFISSFFQFDFGRQTDEEISFVGASDQAPTSRELDQCSEVDFGLTVNDMFAWGTFKLFFLA